MTAQIKTDQNTMATEITKIQKMTPAQIFASEELDGLLEKIRIAATADTPDLSTGVSRKAIASRAASVSKSKVAIDGAGKDLVSEWKTKSKAVDVARKKARDYLDDLRDEVRKPLTDWEAEQAAILAAEQAEAERVERERVAAIERERAEREAELAERERKVREAEELARQEQVRLSNEAAERERSRELAERAERERVEREAAEKQRQEQERIEREKAQAEAAARAEADKKRAVEEARRQERERVEREAAEKQRTYDAEQARLRGLEKDREQRAAIDHDVIAALLSHGVEEVTAKSLVQYMAAGAIPHVSIDYTATPLVKESEAA